MGCDRLWDLTCYSCRHSLHCDHYGHFLECTLVAKRRLFEVDPERRTNSKGGTLLCVRYGGRGDGSVPEGKRRHLMPGLLVANVRPRRSRHG